MDAEVVLGNNDIDDICWLCSLTDSELDLLIGLKSLVKMRADKIGHDALSKNFDLHMLRTFRSSGVRRGNRKMQGNRRSWTRDEEAVLIASMKVLVSKGFKSDNGFRAGYLNRVEEAIMDVFPTTDLKYTQINSKLTSWKKSYYSLTGILNRSGIGFNLRGNFMIDCEDDQWEQVIKADPNCRTMRYKSWPYYEDWKLFFGKDRANGENAEDIFDAYAALRDEDNTTGDGMGPDYDVSLEDMPENEAASDGVSHSANRRATPIPKPKKSKMAAEISGIKEVLGEIGKKTDERLATLAEGIGYEAQLGKARKGAFELLGCISNLSIDARFDVCEILGKERDKLEIFMGLPDDAIPLFVARLLRNKGPSTSSA